MLKSDEKCLTHLSEDIFGIGPHFYWMQLSLISLTYVHYSLGLFTYVSASEILSPILYDILLKLAFFLVQHLLYIFLKL